MMELPMAQEKSKQFFFVQPKAHQFKFVDTNKTVPTDPLKLIAFFEQCQVAHKAAGILEKIAKDKKQLKEKKTAHLSIAHSRESSYRQHCCHNYHDYHQSNFHDHEDQQPHYHHQDKTPQSSLSQQKRTTRAVRPMRRRMIAGAIISRK
jgi:hypothetical protein